MPESPTSPDSTAATAYAKTDFTITDVSLVAEGLRFPEGPIAMPDGSVVFGEIAGECISRVRPLPGGGWSAVEQVAAVPGGPNGLAVGPDGAFYVANNGGCFTFQTFNGLMYPGGPVPTSWRKGSIDRVDPVTGELTTLYRKAGDVELRAPNDLVFDNDGGIWFTDHGVRMERASDRTGIYYAKADGSHIAEVVFPVDGPNGIGLSPAADRVYWAETHTGRVFERPITAPGVVGLPDGANRGCLVGLPGMRLLDSLAVDGDGNVCVATLGATPGITVITPTGHATLVSLPAEFTDPLTTNICFGGDDLKTAYITLSGTGRLVSVPWPVAGLKLAH